MRPVPHAINFDLSHNLKFLKTLNKNESTAKVMCSRTVFQIFSGKNRKHAKLAAKICRKAISPIFIRIYRLTGFFFSVKRIFAGS